VSSAHESIVQANASHYNRLYGEHGDTAGAAQWSDVATQDRRLSILCEIADLRDAKLLDFGCGTGRLYALLTSRGFAGTYVGYDVAKDLIEAAQSKFPEARFECRDVLSQGVDEEFDYVLISGVFNNKHSRSIDYVRDILLMLFRSVRKGLAFNALSTYVDYFDGHLSYYDPSALFALCKTELSPKVVLRHDYLLKEGVIPYEFTIYVYKTPLRPVANRPASTVELRAAQMRHEP
jgi:SAM-dependent methyltransferase